MVRLPSALNADRRTGAAASRRRSPPGHERPAGVHLQWAPPDALLRGQLDVTPDRNRLGAGRRCPTGGSSSAC